MLDRLGTVTFPRGRGDLRLHLAWAELVGLMTRSLEEWPVEELSNCKDGFTFKKFFKCKYTDTVHHSYSCLPLLRMRMRMTRG